MPAVDLALADTDASGQIGELLVRGSNVISGYWNKPEANAEAFVDGWFRTGDIVRIDERGLVYVLDRKKDIVNRGGENVYCVEVENALAQVPGVIESAVCGVPDPVMGEKVGAVIVTRADLDAQDIAAQLRGRIADFKIPQYIVIQHEALARSAAGKRGWWWPDTVCRHRSSTSRHQSQPPTQARPSSTQADNTTHISSCPSQADVENEPKHPAPVAA